jgi:hypothetical protein
MPPFPSHVQHAHALPTCIKNFMTAFIKKTMLHFKRTVTLNKYDQAVNGRSMNDAFSVSLLGKIKQGPIFEGLNTRPETVHKLFLWRMINIL